MNLEFAGLGRLESRPSAFYNNSPRIGPSLPGPQACLSFQGWGDLEDPEGEKGLLWVKFPTEANKRRYCPAMGPPSPWLRPQSKGALTLLGALGDGEETLGPVPTLSSSCCPPNPGGP